MVDEKISQLCDKIDPSTRRRVEQQAPFFGAFCLRSGTLIGFIQLREKFKASWVTSRRGIRDIAAPDMDIFDGGWDWQIEPSKGSERKWDRVLPEHILSYIHIYYIKGDREVRVYIYLNLDRIGSARICVMRSYREKKNIREYWLRDWKAYSLFSRYEQQSLLSNSKLEQQWSRVMVTFGKYLI